MKHIKNYTSSAPIENSIRKIEDTLVSIGARNIMKEYNGFGQVSAIAFSLPMNETVIPFKLPVKVDAIQKYLLQQYRRPTKAQEETTRAQAGRAAWKNILEWVQLQATMIKLEQIEFMEAFMPYIYSLSDGQTFFEKAKSKGFKQLAE